MTESTSTFARTYRSSVDLVASDEMLTALLRGLARLRLELETSRKKQNRARAVTTVNSTTSSSTNALVTATAQSNEEARCWFYATEGAGFPR